MNTEYVKGNACHSVKADIVVLLDSSTSVGEQNFITIKQFTASVANSFNIGPSEVCLSVVTYSTYVQKHFNLNDYLDKTSLVHAINALKYHSGVTNTGAALEYVFRHGFTLQAGDRPDAKNIVIVISDGRAVDSLLASKEATLLHHAGITMIAVGVGSLIDVQKLDVLASSNSLVFRTPNYDSLHHIQDEIENGICHDVHQQQPTTQFPTPQFLPTVKCGDKLANCYQYGFSACTAYRQWAAQNCPKFCMFCQDTNMTNPPLQVTSNWVTIARNKPILGK